MATFYYIVSYYRQMRAFRIYIYLCPQKRPYHHLKLIRTTCAKLMYQIFAFKHQLCRSKFRLYSIYELTQMAPDIVLTNFPNVYRRNFVGIWIPLHISLYIKWIMDTTTKNNNSRVIFSLRYAVIWDIDQPECSIIIVVWACSILIGRKKATKQRQIGIK